MPIESAGAPSIERNRREYSDSDDRRRKARQAEVDAKSQWGAPTGTNAGILQQTPVIGPAVRAGQRYADSQYVKTGSYPDKSPGGSVQGPDGRGPTGHVSSGSRSLSPGNAGESTAPAIQPVYEKAAGPSGTAPRPATGIQSRLKSSRSSLRSPLLGASAAAGTSGSGLIVR